MAVGGSSGKSTVTGLVSHLLIECGSDPSVIAGARLVDLEARGLIGNARFGMGRVMVIEADESDGTLGAYVPFIGVVTNVSRDHAEVDELQALFKGLASRTRHALGVNNDCPLSGRLTAPEGVQTVTYGLGAGAAVKPASVELARGGRGDPSSFTLDGVDFTCPLAGTHSVSNALAAVAVGRALGLGDREMARALEAFRGLRRRLELVGERRGIRVIDDFAHSPAKIRAALDAVRSPGGRTIAVYQPHGYGPARFQREDLIGVFAGSLRPEDLLYMLPIYDAGGTADRIISSRDLVSPGQGKVLETREGLPEAIAREARPGDTVILMGARDNSLPALVRAILDAL